ncbi:hypothetical protein ANSO36C_18710 [Nostoc cf. commune SO-36]|uniref:Uncharacterized protein n=1 Tax=Nostoc cf. commune SO-36 TaxID=449208 RepID=A0ABM7YZD9_NOSCO|nr:hypothetical protein [Nostoc commune]BDI16069.1 hypothetical protein ANSO36C_18710 [Nostoc cf. commune SO-36]
MANKELETLKKLAFNQSERGLEQPLSLLNSKASLPKEKLKPTMNWWFLKIASITGLLYLLFIVLSPTPTPQENRRIGNTEVIIFSLILLFNSGLLDSIDDISISGTGIALRRLKQEVQDDINKLQDEQIAELNRQQRRIDLLQDQQSATLQFLVRYLIDGNELRHMIQLDSQEEFNFEFDNDLARELKHLRAMGFINNFLDKGLEKVQQDGKGDLKNYFHITEEGKSYLALRRTLGINEIPGQGKDGRWHRDIRETSARIK